MEPSVPPGRREPASRAQTRRPAPGRAPPSSCELLLELAEDPSIAALLAGFGVDRAALVRLGGELRASLDPEPADWRVRLAQRGAGKLGLGPLDQLLAIVRSADCHAYQLLEHAGVACGPLRKQIIALLRERGTEAIHREPRRALGRRPTRVAATSDPEVTARVSRTQDTRAQPRPEVASSERGRLVAVDPEALGPLAGRDSELARLADALRRSAPRPPALIGAHGSGRTLIARHLARLLREPIFHVSAPDYEDDEALRADLAVVAGRGGVLILDDLDRVIADAAPPLLPALSQALSSGAPPVLLILSHEGLARLRGWLPGVGEVLDLIEVGPLSPTEAARAVRLASDALLARHGAQLARDAHPAELARLADRFLAGPAMPGRALDLLDLSCARSVREGKEHVRRETWIDIVCERSGLPRERVAGNGAGREERWMLDLEAEIARQVVGHELILSTLADLIRRNRAGFGSDRPVATALLLGPSGVGKTEIAKALAGALFDRPDSLVRLDMSEYAESHAVARIVGAPPGYVGHEHGGALTDPLLARPHCVLLLDEIEKAHRDVHQLLLQVFDEGRLTDGRGRTVDFRHAVIIMTSNLGAEQLEGKGKGKGKGRDKDDASARVLQAARAAFPVELWNRIEAPLVLKPLTRDELLRICQRLVRASSERLFAERGIRYRLDAAACAQLVDTCCDDASLGARPLRHVLTRRVESRIAEAILRGTIRAGSQLEVGLDGDEVTLSTVRAL